MMWVLLCSEQAMVKSKAKVQDKVQAKAEAVDDSKLQEEVTAFAAQIGLGRPESFSYNDFNPKSAGKSVNAGRRVPGKLSLVLYWR